MEKELHKWQVMPFGLIYSLGAMIYEAKPILHFFGGKDIRLRAFLVVLQIKLNVSITFI